MKPSVLARSRISLARSVSNFQCNARATVIREHPNIFANAFILPYLNLMGFRSSFMLNNPAFFNQPVNVRLLVEYRATHFVEVDLAVSSQVLEKVYRYAQVRLGLFTV